MDEDEMVAEYIWTWDDKLIRLLNRIRVLSCPCNSCLIETICNEVCEQCILYNSRCGVIRRNLFNVVEAVKLIFWVVLFGGGMALMFFYGT